MQLNVKDVDYKFVVVSMGIQMMYDGKKSVFYISVSKLLFNRFDIQIESNFKCLYSGGKKDDRIENIFLVCEMKSQMQF